MGPVGTTDGIKVNIGQDCECDAERAYELLRCALEENISGFTFTGLRIPAMLLAENWQAGRQTRDDCLQLVAFEGRLVGRIATLTANPELMQCIWSFVETSRSERLGILVCPREMQVSIKALATLTFALSEGNREVSLTCLQHLFERYGVGGTKPVKGDKMVELS